MNWRRCIVLVMLLGLVILSACGGAQEAIEEIVVEEVAEPAIEQEPAGEAERSESIGREQSAESTPFAPRDKTSSTQVNQQAEGTPGATATAEPVRSVGDVESNDASSNSPRPVIESTPILDESRQLQAGVVDDNAQFADYMAYVAQFDGPDVLPLDVSLRQRIVVLDSSENPALGASVRIYDNDAGARVQTLRTHADGGVWFFPLAVSDQLPSSYDIEVAYNGLVVYADSFSPTLEGAAQVIRLDAERDNALQLDILLLLDTTGSMGDEIAELKANIQAIAQRTIASPAQPDLRFGMVLYRDEGDAYLTQVGDFSADFEQFETQLSAVTASGGGDYPEALHEGLYETFNSLDWRPKSMQLVFLVADAPPHVDDAASFNYLTAASIAAQQGAKIFPLASSGLDARGEYIFRQLAQLSGGDFIFLVDGDTVGQDSAEASSVETNFSIDAFTVDALDDLVMQIIDRELAYQTR